MVFLLNAGFGGGGGGGSIYIYMYIYKEIYIIPHSPLFRLRVQGLGFKV